MMYKCQKNLKYIFGKIFLWVKITSTFCQQIDPDNVKTRMTTFIKTKFNKSDDQTNIDNIELLQILQNIKIIFQNS